MSVIRILRDLAREPALEKPDAGEVSQSEGKELLKKNSDALFGSREEGRAVRTMVMMPSEAAADYSLVKDLLAAGMDCMRINCVHDSEPAWLAII